MIIAGNGISTARLVVLQEDGYDPYRLPYWIRASFIMEERWGELEAEFNAAKDAVQLAEEWGVVSFPSAWWNLLLPCQSNPVVPGLPSTLPFLLLADQPGERRGI